MPCLISVIYISTLTESEWNARNHSESRFVVVIKLTLIDCMNNIHLVHFEHILINSGVIMLTKLFVKSQLALQSFKNDERGVTAIEYAIIGVCMSVVVLAVFKGSLADALSTAMDNISTNITSANTPITE